MRSGGSSAEGLDDELDDRGTGVLLLPGDEQAVTYGVRTKPSSDDEVGVGQAARLVLDAEGLDGPADVGVGMVLRKLVCNPGGCGL